MSLSAQFIETDDLDPIDMVENLAEYNDWEFDRVAEDQIAMAVKGRWRSYSLTLAWAPCDETLRLIATFEMEPPAHRLPALYEVLSEANDNCWLGAFTYWAEPKLKVYRYALTLTGGQIATAQQIDRMIDAAVRNSERFYPAFQLVCWGDRTPSDAMQVAIAEAYGTA